MRNDEAIVPFRISVSEEEVALLRTRIASTRWAEPETVDDGSQGLPLTRLQELLTVWGSDYDWRAAERRWNALGSARTEIDGLAIHFLHVRSPHEHALPLLLTHGWPGSFVEFVDLVGPLTDPTSYGGQAEDAFHVVIPSLPGFGFTERPRERGWGVRRTAAAWSELMSRLGYRTYTAGGGDWGAFVTTELARIDQSRVAAIHLTLVPASPLAVDEVDASESERRMISERAAYLSEGYGFAMEMATRPQTIGASLVDSPAGLAGWLAEKIMGSDTRTPGAHGVVSTTQLLDNISLYWFTGTGASSCRWYWEAWRSIPTTPDQEDAAPVLVPTYCSLFPDDTWPTARRWAERRFKDIHSWRQMKRGGHFPGWEEPQLYVDELRDAFRSSRRDMDASAVD